MEIFFHFEGRDAAHAGGGDGLAVDIIGDIARRIDAGNASCHRVVPDDQIAALLEGQLPLEQFGCGLVAVALSARQKELLREFCEAGGDKNCPQSEGFFRKARKFWDGL